MTVVLLELVVVLALGTAGWLLGSPAHGGGWRLAVAMPLGVAAYALVGLVLLSTQLPVAYPPVALVLTLVAAAVVARRRRSTDIGRSNWPLLGLGLGAVAFVVAITSLMPLVNVTADSFRYLAVARLLAVDGDTTSTSSFLLQSRGLVVGVLHGLADRSLGYLRAVTPLVALSTIGIVWQLVREGTARLEPSTSRWVAAGAVGLLATNHRFLFNAFYVNGHILFAAWLLVLVGVSWRIARDADVSAAGLHATPASAATAGLVAAALVVLRPEGTLVAALAITPVVLTVGVPHWWRRAVLVMFGLTTVLWHVAVLVPLELARGTTPPVSMLGLAGVGVVALLLAAGLRLVEGRVGRRPLTMLHGLAWVAVAGLTVRTPSILVDSVKATVRNLLVDGAWGSSLLLLAALLVVAVLLRRVPGERVLLFPLFTFVPLVILLAFLRESAYRIGPGDSLNRMLLHVLPLAVVAFALSADSVPRWSGRRRDEDDHAAVARVHGDA